MASVMSVSHVHDMLRLMNVNILLDLAGLELPMSPVSLPLYLTHVADGRRPSNSFFH